MMVESGPNMWQLRATGRGRGCSSDRRRRRGQCVVLFDEPKTTFCFKCIIFLPRILGVELIHYNGWNL
ncbi:Protein of unknown function [Gryllus bimaculatus]|nr:Protein of unknown function [Gryllus bimaculatus]